MIGSYVMTQHDCESTTVIPDSVGLASYMLDSHCCQRLVQDARVVVEGAPEQREKSLAKLEMLNRRGICFATGHAC
jgi:hypothetical protein